MVHDVRLDDARRATEMDDARYATEISDGARCAAR